MVATIYTRLIALNEKTIFLEKLLFYILSLFQDFFFLSHSNLYMNLYYLYLPIHVMKTLEILGYENEEYFPTFLSVLFIQVSSKLILKLLK